MPGVGDHRHGLLVVARQHALKVTLAGRLEADPISDLELQHLHMSAQLVEKVQALDDAVIKIDQLSLGELVSIDRHNGAIDDSRDGAIRRMSEQRLCLSRL